MIAEATDCPVRAVPAAPLPLGLKSRQAHVSNVVKLGIGPRRVLILVLAPRDHVQGAIGKGIGQSVVLVCIVAWRHQTQTIPKLT